MLLCKFTVQHYGDCYKIIFLNSNSRGNKIQIDAIVGLPNPLVGGLHNNLVLPEAILNPYKACSMEIILSWHSHIGLQYYIIFANYKSRPQPPNLTYIGYERHQATCNH